MFDLDTQTELIYLWLISDLPLIYVLIYHWFITAKLIKEGELAGTLMRVKAENLWSVEGPELRHRSGSSRLWSNSVSVSPGEERREGHVSTPQPSVISVFTITGWTETIRRCSHIHQWIQTFRLTRFCCLWLLLPLHHVTVLRSSAVSQDGSGPVQTGSAGGGQSQGQVPLSTESCYYPVSVCAEPSVLNRLSVCRRGDRFWLRSAVNFLKQRNGDDR